MRGNIIEELYYGNIDPQDRGYRPKSPAKKASDSLNGLEEKLTEQLAGENKALFLRFCNAYAEFMGESELDTFITGFRLGARFTHEIFVGTDAPFAELIDDYRTPKTSLVQFARGVFVECARHARLLGGESPLQTWQ